MFRLIATSFILCFLSVVVNSAFDPRYFGDLRIEPGPQAKATNGMVWPQPFSQVSNSTLYYIQPKSFQFIIEGDSCDILKSAVSRYQTLITKLGKEVRQWRQLFKYSLKRLRDVNELKSLNIYLEKPCESRPYLGMNEQYELEINDNKSQLQSSSIWGILRGLETFYQLLHFVDYSAKLLINGTKISDGPRFPHRGLHIDTARHFIPLKKIYLVLEGMVMNKLNVLHWHIVDDQSFPYVSLNYPELSLRGAYSPRHVYPPEKIAEVVEAARIRGIRVIPEFDVPGHTRSWGLAFPEILTTCYSDGLPDGTLGPMNPLSNATYLLLRNLLPEILELFKDDYLHLGGDEVPFDCWQSNPELKNYMEVNNLTPSELEGIFVKRVANLGEEIGSKVILWQEVFDNGVDLKNQSVIIQVWKLDSFSEEMRRVTNAGYKAILSSCWYLDHLTSGGDWEKFYNCDPLELVQNVDLVLGGEACMWAEVVDSTNILTRIWPRATAAAERLWSYLPNPDLNQVANRLEEHTCRMNLRDVPAQPPNGPGFCPMSLFDE